MKQKDLKRRETIQKKFGKHISNLRKERDMTTEQLSDKADMERSAIGRIEIGGINPSLFVITKLADAFEMSVSELMKDFKHKK